MTTDEIIKGLESVKSECGKHLDEGFAWICKPIDEAIKALKRQLCEDCISRQAVLDIVNNPLNIRLDEIIKKLPPVTSQPKTAHWIHFANSDDCSGCGWSTGKYISPSDYCPKCGARMIEPKESEEV